MRAPSNPGTVELVSVILPVYKQEDHVEDVVENYRLELDRLGTPYELLLVVNGPRVDRSREVCQALEEKFEAVRYLSIDDGGWGRAVRAGIAGAKGQLLCYTNSARTSARNLFLMVTYGLAFPDTVIKANRKNRAGIFRRVGSLSYNITCRSLFDLPQWDINGTPKIFSREHAGLLQLERDDDLIDLEFNVVCRDHGYPMIEVPVIATERHGGSSTTGWKTALKLFEGAFEIYGNRRG